MRAIFLALFSLCCAQIGVAAAADAPAWLVGEYKGSATNRNGLTNIFVQIKSATIGPDGRLVLDMMYRNDRNIPDWAAIRSEASLVSAEDVRIMFESPASSRFQLDARPDGSMSGSVVDRFGAGGAIRFTKSR